MRERRSEAGKVGCELFQPSTVKTIIQETLSAGLGDGRGGFY
jgi:hypothetical protein